ncbi:lantibiotic dehydratase family protein [Tenacibaculum ovolyticum]|uniref:lantibiotic dehydratase family protein n=1 Tax=Tenacibaculum ovolyticum TaxID=104270 RepID=UPI0022F3DF32|nr:lantibiotic dehydratase family protein [Tenacibaculum ovolyticum]WBX76771.1 lantibiotic dehydratase family protein [Tenacibaculum ovolyticum]
MTNKQNPYTFLKTYCLRTPFYSLNFYKKLIDKEQFTVSDLKEHWDNVLFREAMFLASPELYLEIEKNLAGSNSKKAKKIYQTIFKYLIRISTRSTPFGLFSGISMNTIGEEKALPWERTTTFDTNYLFSLSSELSRIPQIRKQLIFFINSSLYKVANEYRYVEYQYEVNKRVYSIEATEATGYLDMIISEAKHGKTIDQLSNCLINDNISYDEAKNYIETLINNQVLVSELYPNVTGNGIFSEIISVLQKCNNVDNIIKKLKSLQRHLNEIDQNLGNSTLAYENIIKEIKELSIPFEKRYLFQTDLSIKKTTNSINNKHLYTTQKVIPFLIKLNPFKENGNIEQFKKVFSERYGQQEVLLAIALDIESGVGYIQNKGVSDTTPFLQGITPIKKNTRKQFVFDEYQEIIHNKLIEAQQNNEYTIEFTDKDVEHLELNLNHIPDTLSAFTEIIAKEDKQQIILHGFGNGAGKLLGRFCNGNKETYKCTKQITEIEQSLNSDKILAEIVHLPQSRTGNILKRSHLRSYEVPYISKSTLPLSNQLSINDLTVCVRNNKIILKSIKLGKEVLPRLTNAHNYKSKALPIYHFLCDLEFQNKRKYLKFSFPETAYQFSFLPRVIYNEIILSKAKWMLSEKTIQEITHQSCNKLLLDWVSKWREKHHMPKYVQLIEGDNALLIDMTHFESIILFKDTIQNKKNVILEEFLHLQDDIKNDEEYYANEHIFTFYNNKKINVHR